jgi:hypothetical protein
MTLRWECAAAVPTAIPAVNGVADLLGGLSMGPTPPAQQQPMQPIYPGLGLGGSLSQGAGQTGFGLPMGPPLGAPGLGGSGLSPMVGGGPSRYGGAAPMVQMSPQNLYPAAQGMGSQGSLPYVQQSLGPQGPQGLYGGMPLYGGSTTFGGGLPTQGLSGLSGPGSATFGGVDSPHLL